jgi:hypothetical protein
MEVMSLSSTSEGAKQKKGTTRKYLRTNQKVQDLFSKKFYVSIKKSGKPIR